MTTKAEKLHMSRVSQLGCVAGYTKPCEGWPITIHHCGTGMGGGRNHLNVIALCWEHHLGSEGIDGKRMGKRIWEQKYGTEKELLAKTRALLGMTF